MKYVGKLKDGLYALSLIVLLSFSFESLLNSLPFLLSLK